jgi:glycine/D-amino acid oxidase-like deaminating enzyme
MVIGGGPEGIAVAAALQHAGESAVVLEQRNAAGAAAPRDDLDGRTGLRVLRLDRELDGWWRLHTSAGDLQTRRVVIATADRLEPLVGHLGVLTGRGVPYAAEPAPGLWFVGGAVETDIRRIAQEIAARHQRRIR